MDVSQIEDKLSTRTKAIMVVHIYGLPVDLDPVLELCKANNLLPMKTLLKSSVKPIKAGLAAPSVT